METTQLLQQDDSTFGTDGPEDTARRLIEEVIPLLVKAVHEGVLRGDGVALVVRFYPCKGTASWRDFVSWQIAKE